ncbi:BadF/BadG/BcrA/BcrD ATPase family protein [Streptomyces sp. ODS28]|uniref:N-acetylglucosamine kinase n=1 Tax=Streptomyces sp. ODS28 TaxID=3136688 RepID=UPI0031EAAD1B
MGVNASLNSLPSGALLALDAGNSKTDAAVLGPDGAVLGAARGGGFQPQATGPEAAVAELARTVGAAGGSGHRFALVTACLANADLPREERAMEQRIAAYGWGEELRVANDTFAVLRAGLADGAEERHGSGVGVVCGAGINCVGRAADGRTHRFPAIGELSGDWGGGGGLARAALWHAARAEDGRGERTALAKELPAHYGLPSMYALIEALHMGELPGARRHEAVPVLFRVAEGGDPVARRLVLRQAEEIASMATVSMDRLGLPAESTPVVLGGAVAAARHPLLHETLAERFPVLRVVTEPPVLGAGLLALDHTGAPPHAHARLRGHYRKASDQCSVTSGAP